MAILKKYKNELITIGVLGGGYLIYRLIRKIPPTTPNSIIKDENFFLSKGLKLSYTLNSYNGLANTIYNAWFQNTNVFNSVNENVVLSVFSKMKNDLDVIQLIKSFGKRRAPINFISLLTPDVTLNEWLREGLSIKEIDAINNLLTKKGIKTLF